MTGFGKTAEKRTISMIRAIINRIAGVIRIKRRMFISPTIGAENTVSISYAITVCNEAEQLKSLLECLRPCLTPGDEIIVQADRSHVTEAVKRVIDASDCIDTYTEHDLQMDFAQAKNHLNTQCRGQWIFQLDADECPSPALLQELRAIIGANPNVELFKVPRNNIFLNSRGEMEREFVSWPDYQGRIYLNAPERIQWKRPLHEKIHGYWAYTYLPKEEKYAIVHRKDKAQDEAKWKNWKQHFA